MDNQPAIDRGILIPILIGGFSVIGIVVVLLIGRRLSAPAEIAVTPSATRFQYLYLGTEPAITTPLVEGSEIPLTEEPIEEPLDSTPNSNNTPTGSVQLTNTPVVLATSTSTLSSPVAANTYDDTDSRLTYSGNWSTPTNVSGAYQNTLHISDATGNSVSFNFTGQEIQLYYQAGVSLGTVTITFDNDALGIPVSQSQSSGVWTYMLDTAGAHTVVITHTSGGSVNIDRLVIPSPTVTPTRTPTPTP
jgi:hypothetical protein